MRVSDLVLAIGFLLIVESLLLPLLLPPERRAELRTYVCMFAAGLVLVVASLIILVMEEVQSGPP